MQFRYRHDTQIAARFGKPDQDPCRPRRYADMDLLTIAPKAALVVVGVLAGWGIAHVLDPVAPPVGRLVNWMAARLRNGSDSD